MSACLASTKQWVRLAFACLAIVGGGLPAQAVAVPEVEVAAAVHRPALARKASRVAVQGPWRWQVPRSLESVMRRGPRRSALRSQGPPTALYLAHQALLR